MKFTYALIFFIFNVFLTAQPQLEILGGLTHNWGEVRVIDSPLRTRAILKNVGDEPLRIFSVKPSCGCTTAPISSDVILPNDSAYVDIKVDVKQPHENFQKKITFMTSDPKNKNVEYYLVAKVTNPVVKSPSKFAMNKAKIGEEVKSDVILTNKTKETINILRIAKTHDFIDLTIKVGDKIEPGQSIVVQASITPQNAEPIIGSVAISIDNLDMPKINIPLYCVVQK